MADTKLSALTALSGPPAEDDLFYVADTSAAASKSIRTDELVKAVTNVARTYTASPTVPALVFLDSASDHTITIDTASDEAANRTITVPALGGNKTLSLVDLAQTYSAIRTFNHGMLKLRDSADDHNILIQSAGDNAADRTLSIPALAGNDTIVCAGIVNAFTGANTYTNAVQNFIDSDNTNRTFLDFERSNGSIGYIKGANSTQILEVVCSWSGLRLQCAHDSSLTLGSVDQNYAYLDTTSLQLNYPAKIQWEASSVIRNVSNGVIKLNDSAETGGCQLEFYQKSDVATPGTNCGAIGAEDGAGTAEVVVSDEAGTETVISPHASNGPDNLYDDHPGREHVIRSVNCFEDRVEFVNLTKLAKSVEVLTGEKLTHSETLADYNARTGKNKVKRDWLDHQNDMQAKYDAQREKEIADRLVSEQIHAEKIIANDADFAARVAAYAALPPQEKAKKPAPVKREVPPMPEVFIRPVADIRKDPPEWMQSLGIAQPIAREGQPMRVSAKPRKFTKPAKKRKTGLLWGSAAGAATAATTAAAYATGELQPAIDFLVSLLGQ